MSFGFKRLVLGLVITLLFRLVLAFKTYWLWLAPRNRVRRKSKDRSIGRRGRVKYIHTYNRVKSIEWGIETRESVNNSIIKLKESRHQVVPLFQFSWAINLNYLYRLFKKLELQNKLRYLNFFKQIHENTILFLSIGNF